MLNINKEQKNASEFLVIFSECLKNSLCIYARNRESHEIKNVFHYTLEETFKTLFYLISYPN